MGDVAVFAIFGNDDWMTLPWLIYRLAGTYRMRIGASIALFIFLLFCFWMGWIRPDGSF